MRGFRFSFDVFAIESMDAFVRTCRQAERYGYDVVFAADHLGIPAPFPLLVAAAGATERMRVGTLVLNASFWNPALLAREVATTDILTGGRLEVGLGAGHMKWEFDAAGIEWEPLPARVARLEQTITELDRFFTAGLEGAGARRAVPKPVQRRGFGGSGPPLIIGGTGDSVLRVAARHAGIIGVAGVYQVPGEPPGTFRLGTAAEAEERVAFARRHAGDRAAEIEWHLLVQAVIVTADRRAAAEKLVAEHGRGMAVREALETPFLLIGTEEEIAGQLTGHRERYGFSFVTVHEPYMEAFGPVIERLRPDRAV